MNKKIESRIMIILQKFFIVLGILFTFLFILGIMLYFIKIIKTPDWTLVTFYGSLTLFLVWKLVDWEGFLFKELLGSY